MIEEGWVTLTVLDAQGKLAQASLVPAEALDDIVAVLLAEGFTARTSPPDERHLPGKHDQKTHAHGGGLSAPPGGSTKSHPVRKARWSTPCASLGGRICN